MFKLPIILGIKYFFGAKGAFGSFYSIISVIGLTIGVAALIIVLSVMNGFENELKNRILGVVPHLTIKSTKPIPTNDSNLEVILKNNKKVISYAPFTELQAIISYENRSRGVIVSGIDPQKESELSVIPEFLITGNIRDLEFDNTVVIGHWLAKYLGVKKGDTLNIITNNYKSNILGTFPRSINLKIAAIYELNSELDQSLILINYKLANKLKGLMNDQIDSIRIKLDDLFMANEVGFEIISDLSKDFYFSSWMTTQGTLFQAIQLEKRLIGIMLFLIVTVASFNILSTLVTTIKSKEREISILKSMGMTNIEISIIFISLGSSIAILGVILGVSLGMLITPNINTLIDIFELYLNRPLMDAYFINYFPYDFQLSQILTVCGITLLVSIVFCIFPSYRAAKLDPVVALRYE